MPVDVLKQKAYVSTHSRLKAAGVGIGSAEARGRVSTHSRLKAAGGTMSDARLPRRVSTHSRLKAAGLSIIFNLIPSIPFQHTAA